MDDKIKIIIEAIEDNTDGLEPAEYDAVMMGVVHHIFQTSGLKMESRIVGGGKQINLKH